MIYYIIFLNLACNKNKNLKFVTKDIYGYIILLRIALTYYVKRKKMLKNIIPTTKINNNI